MQKAQQKKLSAEKIEAYEAKFRTVWIDGKLALETVGAIAEFFGVSERAIHKWVAGDSRFRDRVGRLGRALVMFLEDAEYYQVNIRLQPY